MTTSSKICPQCGGPVSSVLDGNCPSCLMRLSMGCAEIGEAFAAGGALPGARANSRKLMGDYELLEEIARGGMGVVYRARQRSLNRFVAVKILLGGHYAGELAQKRFRREAESAAALSHPNIVSIYEAGEDCGQLYLAMELVEGHSFAELTREKPVVPREAARLIKTVAEGIHYAHERDVLHRDLKPSNVLLDSFGMPRVTDFGLAKQITSDEDMTITGQVLGSPNYMPPEQADPNRGPVTAASDVYSLGAILYELVTARAPFQANSLTSTLKQVIEREPIPARLLNPSVPRDLETICAKCLEKDPRRRFSSAKGLAEELTRFLNNQPIVSRPAGNARKILRWCGRNPLLATAMLLIAFLLMVIVVGAPVAVWRIDRERAKAKQAELEMRQQLYTALLDEGRAATFSAELGHRVRTLNALHRAAAITNTPELRREAMAAFRLPDLRLEREGLRQRSGSLTAWALDPAFERVAEAADDDQVRISDLATGNELAKLAPTARGPPDQLTWSPDGRYLALKRGVGGDARHWILEVWDSRSFRCIYSNPTIANHPVFLPNSRAIFDVDPDGTILVKDLAAGKVVSHRALNQLSLLDPQERGVFITADLEAGKFAQCHFENGISALRIRRTDDGRVLRSVDLDLQVTSLAWQPRGLWIALTDLAGNVSLFDAASGSIHSLGHHKAQAVSAVFTPDGNYLFTGGWERELICWDMGSLQKSFSIPLDSFHLQVNADGTRCALDTLTSWQMHQFERPLAMRALMEGSRGHVNNAAFSPAGAWVVAIGQNRAGIWPLHSDGRAAFVPLLPDDGSQERAAFCSENEFYVWRDSSCERWRIEPGDNLSQPPKLEKIPVRLPGGLVSVSSVTNGVIITSGRESAVVTAAKSEPKWTRTESGLNAVSANGKWLSIFPPFSKVAHVYELPSFSAVADLTNSSSISRVEFSPSGSQVVLCSMRGCSIWSTVSWKQERELANQMDLLFAGKGSAFWLMDSYRSGGLYSTASMEPLLPLPPGTLPLAASRDGRFLVANRDSEFIELWDLVKLREDLRSLGLDWPDPK